VSASPAARARIALVGYRGCGKTTVAAALAQRRGRTPFDTDAWIERQAGMSVREVFATHGEARFRAWESDAVAHACELDNAVISVGGGAVLCDANRARLRESCFVVWLTASPETLAARLASDQRSASLRPALTTLDPLSEIRTLLAVRTPHYAACCHAQVSTEGRGADAVAAEVDRLAAEAPQ